MSGSGWMDFIMENRLNPTTTKKHNKKIEWRKRRGKMLEGQFCEGGRRRTMYGKKEGRREGRVEGEELRRLF
jgi:hypothetical protein